MAGIGKRIAYMRRLLAAVRGEDLSMAKAAQLIDVTGPSWWRWEVEKDPPTDENVQAIIDLCRESGLSGVTAQWLRYGTGEGPSVVGRKAELGSGAPTLPLGKRMPSAKKTTPKNPRKRKGA